jgi:hypothetical protein
MILVLIQTGLTNLTREPYWYESLIGLLSIPAIIIGSAYSYVLIKKTRIEQKKIELEARKLELEIKEKGQEAMPSGNQSEMIREIVEPIAEGRQIQYLILRFILLFLILRGWALADLILDTLSDMLASLASNFSSPYITYPLMGLGFLVYILPTVGAFITTLILGLPLFREVNKIVGFKKIEKVFQSATTGKVQKDLDKENEQTDAKNIK